MKNFVIIYYTESVYPFNDKRIFVNLGDDNINIKLSDIARQFRSKFPNREICLLEHIRNNELVCCMRFI